ncbi:MAG: hypothetical protein COU29_03780 [Candidatus Magasanikbacteria bacterium CG10_big_fil_rev_8_21_14_0_10_36_32]|uniref:PDZ domain-containing protein n=1 Tax=Candidatus Magasanikbacteria bacterium CG10_big_fil_rev_8_21_14_0_10_36_32 TaxID=1974646 RepID=A0A2M6W5Q8_9BACT|nr:MAG: hypothetical protein COU29_03780 [Candidatus Magasanikbacteria bacterium CG10_big_fil_rev_8_21_14_0_10_36_32]
MIPPHLPAPSSKIKNHEFLKRMKFLAVIIGFGLITGGASAMMVFGWLWPYYGSSNGIEYQQTDNNVNFTQPDPMIFKEVGERVYSIFSELSSFDQVSYLNQKNKMGEAAAVGSDGWLVMFLKDKKTFNNYKKWRALSYDNILYKTDIALYDNYTRLAYFKISLASVTSTSEQSELQMKVVGFAENINSGENLEAFVNNNWHKTQAGELWRGVFSDIHLDSAINYAYDLSGGSLKLGTLVMNARGRLAGFVVENNRLLPCSAVTRVLPKVLNQKKIIYPSFGVAGWFSDEQPIILADKNISGFAVYDVWSRSSILQRGDILLEINGQTVKDENLWYNLGNDLVHLKILRRGQTLEKDAKLLSAGPLSY